MNALNTIGSLALGLAVPLAALVDFSLSPSPLAQTTRAAIAQAMTAPEPLEALARPSGADVVVTFDGHGQIAGGQVRRSSGSREADERALSEALDLASLQRPTEVAGRTLLISTNFTAHVRL